MSEKKFMEGEFRELINADGLKLHARTWKPESSPRALIILIHGYGEHLGYYEELATLLVKHDYLVFGNDHFGFGRSEGPRATTSKFNKFIDDTLMHIKLMKEAYPNLPLFAIGHSMGGTITLKTILKKPDAFTGMVLIGPAVVLSPTIATPTRMMLVKVLSKVRPNLVIGDMEYGLVTRDENEVESMKKDPYRWHSGIRTKFAVEFLTSMQEITKNFQSIKCPFKTIHGEHDGLVDIDSSNQLYQKSSTKDKELKVYEKAFHNLLIEVPDVRKQVMVETLSWIEERTTAN